MLNNNLRNCAQSCSYLKIEKNLNYLLLTRSKSKYKGKKQQNIEKITYEYKNVPDTETTDFEPGEFLPRRLSYMPEGLPQHRGKKIKWWLPDQTPVTLNINPPEYKQEYLDKPNYPPIVEMSTGFMRQKSEERETRLKYYKSLEQLSTFDEKQFEITNLRPIPTFLFKCVSQLYDYLPLYKYMTRTHVFENELPLNYSITNDNQLNDLVDKIKPDILNATRNSIEFETVDQLYEVSLHLRKGKNIARLKKDEALIQNINSICMKQLSINNQSLNSMTTELNSEVHSWWWGNQFNLSRNLKIYKIENVNKVNASCQYQDYSPLNIRMNIPIRPPIENQDDNLIKQKVPEFPTNPFKLGFQERFWYVSNLPGFLPSIEDNQTTIQKTERSDFPFLTYLNRGLLNIRNEMNIDKFNDDDDIVQSMAIIHNFSYLNALAAVHGFTTYSELTYPFTNQCIITNGQYWSFFVYQLNTHSFHSDLPDSDKRNLCWSINNIKLYDEYKDGEFIGLNDDVLKYLIKIYTQKPELTELYSNLRPYLAEDKRSLEIREQTREDMKRRFAQYVSRREKHFKLSRRTYPFEWVYIRNPESLDKFQRLLKKMRDVFPKDKIQPMVHQYSNQK